METNITKQVYTSVNACAKNRIFSLSVILVKNKRRGF